MTNIIQPTEYTYSDTFATKQVIAFLSQGAIRLECRNGVVQRELTVGISALRQPNDLTVSATSKPKLLRWDLASSSFCC